MIKTTIQWATPFSIGLVLALAVAAALGFALLRRVTGGPLGPARLRALWVLRGAIFAVLVLILLNPVRVEETPGSVERPKVIYLLDTSQSMALGKADRTRWDQAVSTVRDAESTIGQAGDVGPRIGVFRFGDRLAAIESPFWRKPEPARPSASGFEALAAEPPLSSDPTPAPTDSDTLLTGSLEALAGRFGQDSPKAVVVFSDGRARDPERASAIARGYSRMKVPIHVVPVGDEQVGGDVAIVSMVAPTIVRKSTRIPVQLFLRSYGYKGRRAEVKLVAIEPDDRPGAILARTPVVLQDGLNSYSMTFESGDQDRKIAAIVDPQPGEVSADNNTFKSEYTIDHTKIRVLYVEGSVDPFVTRRGLFGLGGSEVQGAYAPLQQALMEDPDVECRAVLPAGAEGDFNELVRSDDRGRGLPETPSELFAYDAIILSNVPREIFSDKYMGWIDEWISRRGGGLCMIGGPYAFGSGRWGDTSVGRMLPIEIEPVGRDWDESATALKPLDDGTIHSIWHIAADDSENRTLLKSLPDFVGHNRLGRPKPTAEILAKIGSGSGSSSAEAEPGLAVQPYGRGRTMAMATGISRKFGGPFAQSWGQGDARYTKKFWRNAVYWLTENSSIGRRRLLVETDKRLYRPGESIVLKARAFDENASPTIDYRVAVSVEPRSSTESTSDNSPLRKPSAASAIADDRSPLLPWSEEFDLSKIVNEKGYVASMPIATGKNLPTGVKLTQGLRIELTAYENNTQVDSTAIDVQILDDPSEQQNPLPDHALLKRVADDSGGSVLPDAKALAAMLGRLPITVGPSEIKAMPAWSRWWLLSLLIALLTVEWVWRRRIGLA
jgi:uncharacterized membrane protein